VADFVQEPVFAAIPADSEVATAERAGIALIDYAPKSPAVRAMGALARRLEGLGLRA
jgi:MinD-like ATPase involved in chromosome partitioning or flagellar assembly